MISHLRANSLTQRSREFLTRSRESFGAQQGISSVDTRCWLRRPAAPFGGLLQSRQSSNARPVIRPKRRAATTRRSGPNAEAVPLSGPLQLGLGDAPDVGAAGQARSD